jgi:anti-sigma regulatory factor (Ser/Thr protein kinase)
MGADWPLVNYLRLAALPLAVPCARLQVKVLLLEWELKKLSEPAELCVAELMSNAVKAVQDLEPALRQPIGLRLSSDGARLLIQIWDCSPALPVKQKVDGAGSSGMDLEGGRGLFLVESYSERWDFYPTAPWGGKVVWCVVADG